MKTQEQDATAELQQAEQSVEEVLERIKAGDEKVKPEDLEAAERRVRFAQAKVEAGERRRAEEAEHARLERLGELQEQAARELNSRSARRIRPMVEVRDMGLEVLRQHWNRGYISLGDDAY